MIVSKKTAPRIIITLSEREASLLQELAMSVSVNHTEAEGYKFARALQCKLESVGVELPDPFRFNGVVTAT